MRKQFISAGLALVGAIIAATSCTSLFENNLTPGTEKGTRITLHVNETQWTASDDVRSSYTEGVGISLSGTESISLFYKKDGTVSGGTDGYSIKATKSGGDYVFTRPDGVADDALWYAIVPYSKNFARKTSDNKYGQYRVNPVQFPGADTFDPQADVLLGRPFLTVGATGTIEGFKRLVAPWRIVITGLEDSDKIYSATFALSGDPDPYKDNSLDGIFSLKLEEDFESAVINSQSNGHRGRAITAFYGTGLSKKGSEGWPVWIMANPITMTSGTELTVTVTTATKSFVRTVALPNDMTLLSDKINKLCFDIKGSGFTSSDSILQDFTNQTVGNSSYIMRASDGTSLEWSFTGTQWTSTSDGGSNLPNGLYLAANKQMVIPEIPGKKITKVRLFLGPVSSVSSSPIASISVKDGEDVVGAISSTALIITGGFDGGYRKGAAIDISLSDLSSPRESFEGLTFLQANYATVYSGVALFTSDETPDPNDLYQSFSLGNDLTIGGMTFNKATHSYKKAKLYELTTSTLNAALTNFNVVFLDYDAGDLQDDVLTMTASMPIAGTGNGHALVGRFVNHQPLMHFTNKYIYQQTDDFAIKNVSLDFASNNGFWASAMEESHDAALEDCTVSIGATDKYLFYDSKDSGEIGFRNVWIKNCVIGAISTNYVLFGLSSRTTTGNNHNALQLIDIENCVVYHSGSGPSAGKIIFLNAKDKSTSKYLSCPNVTVKILGNSFYNFTGNMVNLKDPAQINYDNNVSAANLPANRYMLSINESGYGALSSSTSTCCHNHFFDSSSTGYSYLDMGVACWDYFTRSDLVSAKSQAGASSPYSVENTTIGYFPIDDTIVTNGAGANYSTKLWRSWP